MAWHGMAWHGRTAREIEGLPCHAMPCLYVSIENTLLSSEVMSQQPFAHAPSSGALPHADMKPKKEPKARYSVQQATYISALASQNLPASEVAKRFNAQFKTTKSVNAIARKMSTLRASTICSAFDFFQKTCALLVLRWLPLTSNSEKMIPAPGGTQPGPTEEQLEAAGILDEDEDAVPEALALHSPALSIEGKEIKTTEGAVDRPGVLRTANTVSLAFLKSQRKTKKYSLVKVGSPSCNTTCFFDALSD